MPRYRLGDVSAKILNALNHIVNAINHNKNAIQIIANVVDVKIWLFKHNPRILHRKKISTNLSQFHQKTQKMQYFALVKNLIALKNIVYVIRAGKNVVRIAYVKIVSINMSRDKIEKRKTMRDRGMRKSRTMMKILINTLRKKTTMSWRCQQACNSSILI